MMTNPETAKTEQDFISAIENEKAQEEYGRVKTLSERGSGKVREWARNVRKNIYGEGDFDYQPDGKWKI